MASNNIEEPKVDKNQEKNFIKDIITKHEKLGLTPGYTYYILDKSWWRKWCNYVQYEQIYYTIGTPQHPGPIDNSNLLDKSGQVRTVVTEEIDYVYLPDQAWEKIFEWYGGGPPIPKICINPGNRPSIEVRPLFLRIIHSKRVSRVETVNFSKMTTVREFIDTMHLKLGFNKENIRVYDFHNGRKTKLLDNLNEMFWQVPIIDSQYMLIEEKTKTGVWPNEKRYKRYANSAVYYHREPTAPGKTGLSNLGNTCYMASAVQCLSQTVPLIDFFLTDNFKNDINIDNPLGQKGELAEAYADLLRQLWSVSTSVVEPRLLKKSIEKCDPRFAGYQQHDSQELLIFLLDGIHEDLNRVRKKPYVEKVEGAGVNDEAIAEASWAGHKARNNSIIVDYFQGQLKSTLTCPINGRVSTTFDPFMYLTVPIMPKKRKIIIKVYWMKPNIYPEKFGVNIEKEASIEELLSELSQLCKIPKENLALVEVFSSRFLRQLHNSLTVNCITEGDIIHAHEIIPTPERNYSPPPPDRPPPPVPNKYNSITIINLPYTSEWEQAVAPIESTPIQITVPIESSEHNAEASVQQPAESHVQAFLAHKSSELSSDSQTITEQHPIQSHDQSTHSIEQNQNNTTVSETHSVEGSVETQSTDSHSVITPVTKEENEDIIHVPVLFKRSDRVPSLFSTPLIISVKKNITYNELYTHIIERLSLVLKKPPAVEEESSESDNESAEKAQTSPSTKKPRFHRIFDISLCNSRGDLEETDEDHIVLEERQTIALIWTKEYYKEYFDKKKDNQYYENPSVDSEDTGGSNNLMDCLKLFTKEEQLGVDDPWYCSECKDFRQAFKKFHIWTSPPILIIHLKRFSYRNSWREKLEQFIHFPIDDLDISEFVIGPKDNPPLYDLYAVSNHMGGISHGHYTAFAKLRDDGKWYCFDDQSVKEIPAANVCSPNAYVLFYKRKDIPWAVFDKSLDKLALQTEEDNGDEEDSDETPPQEKNSIEGNTPNTQANNSAEVNPSTRQENSTSELNPSPSEESTIPHVTLPL